MSEKIRTTVSIHRGIMEKAREIMAASHFSDFSGFLEQIIRDEWGRRQIVVGLNERSAAPSSKAQPSAKPVTYRGKPRKHK